MNNPIEERRRLVQERIAKSFDSGINIAEEMSLEKAWNVGDEKQYQGVTYYVHSFNAKGKPLWRKKKDGEKKTIDNHARHVNNKQVKFSDKEKKRTRTTSK